MSAVRVIAVDAPFQDARAAQLSYSLDHPRVDPLASASGVLRLPALADPGLPAELPARSHRELSLHVELGVLGTSHQVTVTCGGPAAGAVDHRARGRVLIRETLACLPTDTGGPVPHHRRATLSTGTIDVVHDVRRPADLGGDADAARAAASAMAVSCAAGFPGDPHALTILGCDADGDALVWRTWHCYPQAGEIVESRTRFAPAPLR